MRYEIKFKPKLDFDDHLYFWRGESSSEEEAIRSAWCWLSTKVYSPSDYRLDEIQKDSVTKV